MHSNGSGSERSSVIGASLWMVGVSVALFFLPAINGLIGGLVGGYKVGGMSRAVVAAILPAAIVGLVLWILFAVFEAPVIGFVSGLAVVALIVFSSLGLLLGAAIGGALSSKR
jgi:hypothetical protein